MRIVACLGFSPGQTMYNTAVDESHNLLYVATSGGNSAGRSIIELPLTISGETMPYKVPLEMSNTNTISRWSFLKFWPCLRKWSNLTNIFQIRQNHQLDLVLEFIGIKSHLFLAIRIIWSWMIKSNREDLHEPSTWKAYGWELTWTCFPGKLKKF